MKKIPEVKREFECPVCKMKWKGAMYYILNQNVLYRKG